MPYTVEYRAWLEAECARHGILFFTVGVGDPCRAPSKRQAMDQAYLNQPKPGIPTRHPRSCTMAWKVQPARNLLTSVTDLRRGKWAQGDLLTGRQPGRHRFIIGIAADESGRCGGLTHFVHPKSNWVESLYPMVQYGITREDAAEAIRRAGWPNPGKSGCFACVFQPIAWFWAIKQLWPHLHQRSVAMESAALAHNPKLCLTGRGPLDEAIAQWVERQNGTLPADPWSVIAEGYDLKRKW